jgi:hypothetical protein
LHGIAPNDTNGSQKTEYISLCYHEPYAPVQAGRVVKP